MIARRSTIRPHFFKILVRTFWVFFSLRLLNLFNQKLHLGYFLNSVWQYSFIFKRQSSFHLIHIFTRRLEGSKTWDLKTLIYNIFVHDFTIQTFVYTHILVYVYVCHTHNRVWNVIDEETELIVHTKIRSLNM